jgi:4-hydroxy-tetrahydrodipicolinate synthase
MPPDESPRDACRCGLAGSLSAMAETSTLRMRRVKPPFGRMVTAMVTPFDADGGLDVDAAVRLATYLVDRGNDGLVISGTTGESPTTTDGEKERLLRAVVDAVGDRAQVIAGVGTYDTHHTIELAQAAEKCGASGLLVVTPFYNKPPQAGLQAHFQVVANATGLPVMVYDIPGRTGMPIDTETLVRLAEHDRIVAVKDAKGDLYASAWVMARSDLVYYSGDDALNLPHLAQGAVGMVSVVSHVATPAYVSMIQAVQDGNLAAARQVNARLLPAVRGVMTRTQGAIMAKAALQLLGVLEQRTVRLPLVDATDEQIRLLRDDLAEAGVGVEPPA